MRGEFMRWFSKLERYLRIGILFLLVLNAAANLPAQTTKKVFVGRAGSQRDVRHAYLKQIQKCAEEIKSGKNIPVLEAAVLLDALQGLQEEGIFSRPPDLRKKSVESAIGVTRYRIIENYYLRLLKNGTSAEKKVAMSILGPGLLDTSSIDRIKKYVFTDEPGVQFYAIWSLTYFDIEGMQSLLSKFVFAHRVPEASKLAVLKALKDTNSPELGVTGLWIIFHEKDASLLTLELKDLEETKSYPGAIRKIFLSGSFPISDRENLSREEKDINGLNSYILASFYRHWVSLVDKKGLLETIAPLVENRYDNIYIYSALIVHKYGNAEQKKMMRQETALTEDKEKKEFLERLISGI